MARIITSILYIDFCIYSGIRTILNTVTDYYFLLFSASDGTTTVAHVHGYYVVLLIFV